MLWIFVVALHLSVLVNGTKRPGRKEIIFDETYFGNEQLLNTEIDDVKPFIDELTLPETGLEVTGSVLDVQEQFKRHNKENVTYSELWPKFTSNSYLLFNFFLSCS